MNENTPGISSFFSQDRRRKQEIKSPSYAPKATPTPKPAPKMAQKVVREVPPQIQKNSLRTYPTRTFDQYPHKKVTIRDEDITFIENICYEISRAKRQLPTEQRNPKRITANTVYRILIEEFCQASEENLDSTDFLNVQDDESLRWYIKNTLKKCSLAR